MMKKSCTFLVLSLILLGSTIHIAAASPVPDNKKLLTQALYLFNKGNYEETIAALDQIRGDSAMQGTVEYWQGLCRFRMKDYDEAIQHFQKAVSLGDKSPDLYFTLGQSYYASQKLKNAREAFEQSAANNFKVGASYYYIGFIYQALDEDIRAAEYYHKVEKLPNDEDKVKQASRFQLAELYYDRSKKIKSKNRRNVLTEERVIPMYEVARDYEDDTPAYTEAERRIKEIMDAINKDKPKSAFTFRATFDLGYDSNVITKADESIVSVSDKDSVFFKPTLRMNYEKKLATNWTLTAGLRGVFKIFQRQSTPDVYKNDNITAEPNLEIVQDHTLFDKDAAFIFNYEFNYQWQDWEKKHERPYYSRSQNFEFSERINPFAMGSTTFKTNFKFYESYNPGTNSFQPSIELNQKIKMGASSLSMTVGIDWLRARLSTNDTTTYKINTRYPIDLSETITLTPKFNFSVLDPREQMKSRGYEKKLAPGASLRKSLRGGSIVRLSYDFTRNLSFDKVNYAYKRHELTVTYEFTF